MVLVGIVTLVSLLYIERRKKFSGPHIDTEELNERNAVVKEERRRSSIIHSRRPSLTL